jgi:hypothetical protein
MASGAVAILNFGFELRSVPVQGADSYVKWHSLWVAQMHKATHTGHTSGAY